MENEKSFLGTVFTWLMVIVAVVVAFKIAVWLLGATLGLAGFLVFHVLPIVLVGWLVVKGFQYLKNRPAV